MTELRPPTCARCTVLGSHCIYVGKSKRCQQCGDAFKCVLPASTEPLMRSRTTWPSEASDADMGTIARERISGELRLVVPKIATKTYSEDRLKKLKEKKKEQKKKQKRSKKNKANSTDEAKRTATGPSRKQAWNHRRRAQVERSAERRIGKALALFKP
ncbi:hypothetical protein NCC49_005694 [Naganishia albida]|nr:hypothetical protein NCC49_005694 [Naganishia albida]